MSHNMTTNSGWPDPSDWIKRLHEEMAARQANYDAEPDVLLKRNKAGGMLGSVVQALMELPAFKEDMVHLPLKDMLIFLADLDRGRDHPWSAAVNFGGTNVTTTATAELKIWVRATYGILKRSGFRAKEACERIAMGLNENGRSGRNGPVRWRLVQQWCREEPVPARQHVQEKVDRWWTDFRAETANIRVIDGAGLPVTEKEMAGLFADQVWSMPHLRDRSFSGGSE
jgi:hypothetical protein